MIGFKVVGKPAATDMTSSPALRRRSPRRGLMREDRATRFAEEPEFTRKAYSAPQNAANSDSKALAIAPLT